MPNPVVKHTDIDFEEELDLLVETLKFIYKNNLFMIQTPFHEEYSIPPRTIFTPNISDCPYIKIQITDMDIYNKYQRFNKFVDNDQFRTKLRFINNDYLKTMINNYNINGSTKFEYEPIIKSSEEHGHSLKYFLPYQKIRIGYPEGTDSEDHNTKMRAYFSRDDDEYFEYSFRYKLYKNVDGIRQKLNFESFDDFTNLVNQGTNIRFIVEPRLRFKCNPHFKNTLIYFIRLEVSLIEIK